MPIQKPHARPIIIAEQRHGLPYSKGLMASSMMAAGLPPGQAYHAATLVEDRIREQGRSTVSIVELKELAASVLTEVFGAGYAEKYRAWENIAKLDKPLLVLLGGTTGVGKSTVATALAGRLGITRIVSTDAIREVMRSIFSEELAPLLYESSFTAWRRLRVPLPKRADPVVVGFREQTQAVLVGINAIVNRAIHEGVDMIVEGVHLVPGELPVAAWLDRAFVTQAIVHVEDEHLHRSHFYIRELETNGYRPFARYRANFDAIRKIGEHLVEQAVEHAVPVINSRQLDATIKQALDQVVSAVMSEGAPLDASGPDGASGGEQGVRLLD